MPAPRGSVSRSLGVGSAATWHASSQPTRGRTAHALGEGSLRMGEVMPSAGPALSTLSRWEGAEHTAMLASCPPPHTSLGTSTPGPGRGVSVGW